MQRQLRSIPQLNIQSIKYEKRLITISTKCKDTPANCFQNTKTLHLLSKMTWEKQKIFIFKQLETANVWHFCLKNKTTHRLWKYSALPHQAAATQTILCGVGVRKRSHWKLVFSPWKVWRDVLLLAWTLCNTRLNCATRITSIRGWGRPAPAIMQRYSTRTRSLPLTSVIRICGEFHPVSQSSTDSF